MIGLRKGRAPNALPAPPGETLDPEPVSPSPLAVLLATVPLRWQQATCHLRVTFAEWPDASVPHEGEPSGLVGEALDRALDIIVRLAGSKEPRSVM